MATAYCDEGIPLRFWLHFLIYTDALSSVYEISMVSTCRKEKWRNVKDVAILGWIK